MESSVPKMLGFTFSFSFKISVGVFELEKWPLFVQRKDQGNDGGCALTSPIYRLWLDFFCASSSLSLFIFRRCLVQSRKFIVRSDYAVFTLPFWAHFVLSCFAFVWFFASGNYCFSRLGSKTFASYLVHLVGIHVREQLLVKATLCRF